MPGLDNSDQELMIDRRAPGIVEEKEEHHDGARDRHMHDELTNNLITCGSGTRL